MDNTGQARSIKYYEAPNGLDATKSLQYTAQLGSTLGNDGEGEKKPKNVMEHAAVVDKKLDNIKEESIELKRHLEIAKSELERINITIDKTLNEFVNMMMVGIDARMKELQANIEEQKEENTSMQIQLTETRKEHSEVQQRIILGGKKVTELKEAIGQYDQD